jgi:hypothetical protein
MRVDDQRRYGCKMGGILISPSPEKSQYSASSKEKCYVIGGKNDNMSNTQKFQSLWIMQSIEVILVIYLNFHSNTPNRFLRLLIFRLDFYMMHPIIWVRNLCDATRDKSFGRLTP